MTVHQSYIHRLLKVYFWLSIKSRGIICDQTEQVMKIAKVSWNLGEVSVFFEYSQILYIFCGFRLQIIRRILEHYQFLRIY